MNPFLTQAPVLLFAAMALSFMVVLGFVSVGDAMRKE